MIAQDQHDRTTQARRQSMQSVALAVEASMDVDGVQQRLLDLPDQIRSQQDLVQEARQAMDMAKAELQVQESVLVSVIAAEVNPKTGKPAYSNAEARKAELAQRQTDSPEYQSALQAYRDAESRHSGAQFDLELLTNQFSATRTVAGLMTSRLGLMAGLS